MGAHDWMRIAEGANPDALFKKLRGEDLERYGADPYTGDIGQKDGFRMVPAHRVEAAVAAALADLEDRRARLTAKAQKELRRDLEAAREAGNWDLYDRAEERLVHPWYGEDLAAALKRERAALAKRKKALSAKRWSSAKINAVVDCLNERVGKWDPAQCIKVGARRFVFFGWAAE